MFKSVGYPVAINPTKELLNKIIENERIRNKLQVIVERKDVVYKLKPQCIDFII